MFSGCLKFMANFLVALLMNMMTHEGFSLVRITVISIICVCVAIKFLSISSKAHCRLRCLQQGKLARQVTYAYYFSIFLNGTVNYRKRAG